METTKLDVSRRDFILLAAALSQSKDLAGQEHAPSALQFGNPLVQATVVGSKDCLWSYRARKSGREFRVGPPVFNVDGQRLTATLSGIERSHQPLRLDNGTTEYAYRGTFAGHADLSLEMVFRVAEDNPIIRFRYALESKKPHTLTKPTGSDDLVYLEMSLAGLPQSKEIRFSNFVELSHSYMLEEVSLEGRDFEDQLDVMGPMIVASDGAHSMLMAYEHGSPAPDAFLRFELNRERTVKLHAVKGNYVAGQAIDPDHRYETLWLETGAVDAAEDGLASAFRTFVLKHMTENHGSRRSNICYNSWNFQERNKWWNGKMYLDSMNEERMLSEIDVAHRMGIDVFVLDTGWYARTGEWTVSRKRFPDGIKEVRARLEGYGMKLGLWFGPTSAAATSDAYLNNKDCVMSWKGVERKPYPVWETESSYPMCLVSRYSDAFADQLIHVAKELGVTYFKWDGVNLYGCDSPHHGHGNDSNTPQERMDSYAFQLVRQMSRMADRLAKACREAIVDYDVTERNRAVGLAFLSSGRFFLINNGPYYQNFDIPFDREHSNSNLFFHAGPARAWICRLPLGLDKWIPSSLFLAHYFPDDPVASQEVNVASLMLGQNGIWGDLPGTSDAGVDYIGNMLARYKQVREAITESDPVVSGLVSGSPEIHEKISMHSGKGMVVTFATSAGRYSYVTRHKVVQPNWGSEGAKVSIDSAGSARLSFDFDKPGAKVVFFGVA
jgi:alpha-galactosidase